LGIGIHGNDWAIMPPPGQACDDSHLGKCIPIYTSSVFHFYTFIHICTIAELEIIPHVDNALVFYFGPMTYNPKLGIQDFMSLELQQSFAVLYIDYRTGTVRLDQNTSINGRQESQNRCLLEENCKKFRYTYILIKYINYFNVFFFSVYRNDS